MDYKYFFGLLDNGIVIGAINIIIFFCLIYLCYFYFVALPKQHKEIISFLEEKKHLSKDEVEFLESFSKFDDIWNSFNRPLRGVKFEDDVYIADLIYLSEEVKKRYAQRQIYCNFRAGIK